MSALKNIKGGEISILIHEHEKKTGKKIWLFKHSKHPAIANRGKTTMQVLYAYSIVM